MQIKFRSPRRNQTGFALMIIMVFVGVSLITFASMLLWTSTNSRITDRNNLFNQAEAAAESATEVPLAAMIRDFTSQSLNSAASYQTNFPSDYATGWPVQYQYSDLTGTVGRVSVTISGTSWQVLDGTFSGQGGLVQDCTNTATATPQNQSANLSASVQQTVKFAIIPLFQYAAFYNMDMEINPGNAMVINGHVHSNNAIYATGSSASVPLTINGNFDASTGINYTRKTNYDGTDTRTGNVIVTNGVINPNVGTLTMPIGTNNDPTSVRGLLGIPPASLAVPNAAGYSTNGTPYLYNSSDLIISNAASGGTNITVYYNNQLYGSGMTKIDPDVVQTNSAGAITNSYYSFVTNVTFYDYRESDTVKATQISVTNLNTWLANTSSRGGAQYNLKNSYGIYNKGHGINSIYVFNSATLASAQLPAVRLVNGQQLPAAGLTVSTAQPLYVQGDYNTTTDGVNFSRGLGDPAVKGNTVPAALMGDSITVLSSAWQDSNDANTSLGSRNASPTTINAATLEGIVQSTLSGNTKLYSGGLENFLRLQEDWSGGGGVTLTYNGSIVVLFPSQYATNAWANASYGVPKRQWGFDLNFTKGPQYLPPLTPTAKYVYRRTWAFW
jgi:Tfp pilus assembly protein PilX